METNGVEKPKISKTLDSLVYNIGLAFAWSSSALVAVIIIQVIMRYGFSQSNVALEEMQWHLYGIMLIIAISYTLVTNKHIRLDVFYCRFSPKTQAKVDFFGMIFLFLPMVFVIFSHGLDVFADSWRVFERSDSPTGLCCRWLFKAFFPAGMILYGLAGISRAIYMFKIMRQGDDGAGAACHVPPPAEPQA